MCRLLIISFLFCCQLNAQLSLGFQAGYGRSAFGDFNSMLCSAIWGKSIKLCLEKKINDHFSVNLGIGLDNKGANYGYNYYGTITGATGSEYHFTYLTISLLVDYHFRKFLFFGGIYQSTLLKASVEERGWYITNNLKHVYNDERSCKSDFKGDFGITAGLGYSFTLNDKLEIPLRISQNYELTGVDRYDGVYTNELSSTVFSVALKYKLN